MPRICMLNPFFLPYQGGTEKHILEVGSRLASKGFDITVLTVRMPNTSREETIGGMTVRRVNALMLLKSVPPYFPVPPPVAVAPTMSEAIKLECDRQDLFHIHNRFFYSPADAGQIKKAGKKLCLTLHNARPQGISPTTDFFGQLYDETNGKALMNKCDHIFGVSQNTLDITVPKEFRAKTSVAYNGVDTDFFSPKVGGKDVRKRFGLEGKKVLLTVCRLEEQKGLRYMIDALKTLVEQDKDYVWVLLGRGSMEKSLKKIASSKPLYGHFIVISKKVPDPFLAQLYAACDVFALPSVWEPFGMVLCEAMSTGKPVVSTTAGGIPEVVSKECGMLCEPKDGACLAESISRIFSSGQLLKRMGHAGRSRAVNKFTWDRTAQCYEKLYDSILG